MLCLLMLANGTLRATAASAFILFILFVVILVFMNRARTQKKSKLIIARDRIEMTYVRRDGYNVFAALGHESTVRTYTVVRPDKIVVAGNRVTVYGDVYCVEEKAVDETRTRKETRCASFIIPPYFAEWANVCNELQAMNGGRQTW